MDPKELLSYTQDAARYFLKDNSPTATYVNLGGYTYEDVAMDSIVKILESSVRPQTKTYVIEVVRNTCFDLMKQRKLDVIPSISNETMDHQLVPLDTIDSIQSAVLSKLDIEDQDLYLLWVTHGKTEEEIADTYDVSPRTIRRRLQELRTHIMEALDAEGHE